MKILTFYFLTFIVVIFLPFQSLAQNTTSWEKFFTTAEKAYQLGSYNSALKKSKAGFKKNGTNDAFTTWQLIQDAKSLEALGKYDLMESKLQEAAKNFDNLKNSDFKSYAVANYKSAEVYIEYGDFVKADKILSNLQAELSSKIPVDSLLQAEIDYRKTLIYKNQWKYNEAKDLNDRNLAYWLANQVNNYKGLSKAEELYKKQQYANMLRLSGEIISNQGDFAGSNEIFESKEKEISKYVNRKSLQYANYLSAIANNYFESDQLAKAGREYAKALKTGLRKSSKVYFDNSIRYVQSSFDYKRFKIAKSNLEYVDKIIYAYYRGKNIYSFKRDLLNAEWSIHQRKFKSAEKQLVKILEESKGIIPLNNPFYLKTVEKLYGLHIRKGLNFISAEDDLDTASLIIENLYGAESPKNLNNQVRKSVFLLENTDRVKEGISLMSGRPQDRVLPQLFETSEDRLSMINFLAVYNDNVEQYDSALVYANTGLDLLVKRNDSKDEGIKIGKQSKVLNKIRSYIDAWRSKELPKQYLLLAKIKTKKGDYKGAELDMITALDIFKKRINAFSTDYADALSSVARLYGIIGLYDEAESLLKKSSRIYRRSKVDVSQNAKAIEELAFLYARIGEYAETEVLLQQVIKTKEVKYGNSSKTLINPLNQLGQLYLITGDYKNADKNIRKANVITKNIYGENTLIYSENLLLLTKLSMAIGDYERAEEYLNQAIIIQKRLLGESHILLASSYTDLGYVKFYLDSKNIAKTTELFESAKTIVAQNFDNKHPLYAESIKNIAFVYIEEGRYQDATALLEEANLIWVEKLGEENKNSAEIAVLLGDIDSRNKDFSAAEQSYIKAQKLYGDIFSKENPSYIATVSKLGRNYFAKGNYAEATKSLEQTTATYLKFLQNYFPSLSEREKSKYWSLMKPDFEFYNTLAIKQATTNPAMIANMYKFALSTKALLLSSSIKVKEQILNGTDEELKTEFKEWINKKELLTNALSMSDAQLKEADLKPAQLEKEVENLEKELSTKSDAFKNTEAKFYTWEDVKLNLKSDEAAVEIIRFRLFTDKFADSILYAALIVTPTTLKQPDLVVLNNGKDLENKLLRYYRNTVRYQKDDKLSYKYFWQPIEAKIGSASRVYFSPDGAYNQINLESLLIEDTVFVIDKVNIRLVSNTKDLIEKALEKQAIAKSGITRESNKTAMLVGDPVFYASLVNQNSDVQKEELVRSLQTQKISYIGDLPGTGIEINEIQKLLMGKGWQVTLFDKQNAEESKVKLVNSPTVFHIATHGFFVTSESDVESVMKSATITQSPLLRSGLLMEGSGDLLAKTPGNFNSEEGVLTAAEVPNLNFDQTELVVLSACETGLGEVQIGEGVFGLQRSFLVAGTDALIMSLFKVSDEVTQKLMTKFYQKWLDSGDKRKAFNDAQKEIKAEYKYPKYWGAFNMIGVE